MQCFFLNEFVDYVLLLRIEFVLKLTLKLLGFHKSRIYSSSPPILMKD